mgnify:CR=1 FL=1
MDDFIDKKDAVPEKEIDSEKEIDYTDVAALKEMEKKEAKYAKLDKEVEDLDEDAFSSSEDDEEDGDLYRDATEDESAWLDSQETVKVYRAMQVIDGSHNVLESIDTLRNMTDIGYIYMDYNQISNIDSLADSYCLVQVNVFGNPISDVASLREHDIIVNYDPT